MRYIDSGARERAQALGSWLETAVAENSEEIRWQSGFFSSDSLALIQEPLRRLTREQLPVHALIGSNDRATLRADVEALVSTLGIPRQHALLGVVNFGVGYFHPKTFHVKRGDGSQASYVGSANLTGSGVSSLHVEAGVVLDTREGDPPEVLDAIADWSRCMVPRKPTGPLSCHINKRYSATCCRWCSDRRDAAAAGTNGKSVWSAAGKASRFAATNSSSAAFLTGTRSSGGSY